MEDLRGAFGEVARSLGVGMDEVDVKRASWGMSAAPSITTPRLAQARVIAARASPIVSPILLGFPVAPPRRGDAHDLGGRMNVIHEGA